MAFSESLKSRVRKWAHYACCLCKDLGVEVHHIISQKDGGPDTEDNAAPLCPSCHDKFGANPQKRKFISEARDTWYEICKKRYSPDKDSIEKMHSLLQQMNDKMQIDKSNNFRSEDEINDVLGEFVMRLWYDRHLAWRDMVESGKEKVDPEIWNGALDSEKEVRRMLGKKKIGPYSDFEWGMLSGKVSALRWVEGDEWDMLDT